ncbi:hypothetical protein CKO_00049 [Citrobacter koseri ATCC BAA-895]|uniref:Uncharacterized protein n=1 Tax=Citrobacter koseri (strain ATCC BAA-895 / CDC 4225-83 / SGSC4696) TaxID=290338 RepID=A8ACL5_CITK8|nr:hypothetical protein CKO_00049 [Citrobacter koseri ATCC BAA-895]
MGIVQRVEDYTDCRAKRKDRTGSLLDRLCSIASLLINFFNMRAKSCST